jgi:hypothetical protein
MRLDLGRHILGIGLTALLGGCGGTQTAATNAIPQGIAGSDRAARGGSWMSPDAKKLDKLVYVSEWPKGPVSVYEYQTARLVGRLTGFDQPTGQCVDGAGDIWIAQADGRSVAEYAHGGSSPIKTLHTSGRAFGCSVSPNGDLAVANFDVGSAPGSIQVFKNASGSPKEYTCPGYGYYEPPGYDGKGNLYVEVLASLREIDFGVCRLPSGGSALQPVKVNVTINSGASVMWDGKYITLTDVNYKNTYTTAIYQAKESRSGDLKVIGTTVLEDGIGQPAGGWQPFILGKKNTPDNTHQSSVVVGLSDGVVSYWSYPLGGKPAKSFPIAFFSTLSPFGEAVSIGR